MNDIIHGSLEETQHILEEQNDIEAINFAEWIKQKAYFRYSAKLPQFPIYNNFIYWCNFGINVGSEQNKLRPAIVVRTESKSTICTVIPLTSERINDNLWYHIDLENENSTALVEQLRVVSKIRIVNPYRKKGKLITITENDWNNINSELKRLYQLRKLKEN